MLKPFFISFVSFIVLDFIWLGFVMKDFNLRQLAEIGRIENGTFQILYVPALLTYILMALAVTFFVLPKAAETDPWWQLGLWGALLGLIVYGVFDLTNLAILKNYPVPFIIADMAWGTAVFAIVSVLTRKLQLTF